MNAHYTLDEKQYVKRTLIEGGCIPYLIERDGKDFLCVMEGGAYHQYEIGPQGLARLAEEATKQLRKHLVAPDA